MVERRNRNLLELELQICLEFGAKLWRWEGWQVIWQLHWIDFMSLPIELKRWSRGKCLNAEENRQLKLKMFKLIQAPQQMMAYLFTNVLQNFKK